MSTLSKPTPHLAIIFRFTPASITSLSIEVALRMKTKSASGICSSKISLLFSSDDISMQVPILFNSWIAKESSLSQIKIFMLFPLTYLMLTDVIL